MNQEQFRKDAAEKYAVNRGADKDKKAFRTITNRDLYSHTVDCFEAGAEWEAGRNKWNDVSVTTPNAYEDGNWDGLRSDFVLAEKENGSYIVARVYEGKMDGTHFIDWVNDRDDVIDQPEDKIVRWKRII